MKSIIHSAVFSLSPTLRLAGMVAICEDLPEPTNCVTIDPTLKDSDGVPAPKVNYTLSANSTCPPIAYTSDIEFAAAIAPKR